MATDNGNERESRDGFFSSENGANGDDQPAKKKRTRVGDLRKQAYDVNPGPSRERNPYRDGGDNRRYDDRQQQGSSYRPSENRPSRSYDNNDRRSYGGGNQSRDNRGGYQDNRGGGYQDRGGYNDNRGNRSGGGGYSGGGGNPRYNNNNRRPGGGGGMRPGGGPGRPSTGGVKRLVKPVKYKENIDPNTPLRLNKYLANAGVCSRREADAYITSGVVKVNGEVVDQLGAKVTRGDLVTFQDKPVRLESKVYVLLNKPKNCVTTSDDPQNRLTVMDLVKNACPERIYPVGRLDRNTTGVLLLTNDGDLASKLMHPKFKKKKIYQVTLDRDVAIEDMQAIADGVELDDGEIHADSIAYQSEDMLSVVGIEIHSGRNRIVRRIFEKLGYQVMKLDRVYFAGLTKKNVLRGKWRYLTEKEVNMLRMGAFE